MPSNRERLVKLGMVPSLAAEVAAQIDGAPKNAFRLRELSMVAAGRVVAQMTLGVGNSAALVQAGFAPELAGELALQISGGTPTPTPSAPSALTAPTIDGTALLGNVLIANPGTYTNNPTSYSYQWKVGGVDIAGATARLFSPGTTQIAGAITVVEAATNGSGSSAPNPSTATGAIVPWSDSYTVASDTLLENIYTGPFGQSYIKALAAGGAVVSAIAATGRAKSSANSSIVYFVHDRPPSIEADYRVKSNVYFNLKTFVGIGARVSSPAALTSTRGGYYFYWDDTAANWLLIAGGSTGTVLDTIGTWAGDVPAAGQTKLIELDVSGTGATVTLSAYIDGVQVITGTHTNANRITAPGYPAIYALRQDGEFADLTVTPSSVSPLASANSGVWRANPDGCWTWFNSNPSVVVNGIIYIGAVDSTGRITITKNDGGKTYIYRAATVFEKDDHDNPALIVLPSGRLMAVYSKHNGKMEYIVTTNALPDITSWRAPVTIYDNGGDGTLSVTYANVSLLSDGYVRVFSRRGQGGGGTNPCWMFKETAANIDAGTTSWPAGVDQFGVVSARPYVQYYWKPGDNRIDFILSSEHPNEGAAAIYHCYLTVSAGTESYFKSDGTPIAAALPFDPTLNATLIQSAAAGVNWTFDCVRDASGAVHAATTKYPSSSTGVTRGTLLSDIEYWVHRYSGGAWTSYRLLQNQKSLYAAENCYAGGLKFDANDPTIIYASELTAGLNNIKQYRMDWSGPSKSLMRSAPTSTSDQNRPYSLRNHPRRAAVFWWEGTYTTFSNYSTRVMAMAEA